MKKHVLTNFLFLFFFLLTNAQFVNVLNGKSSLHSFYSTTTCVVLTEDEEVNDALKKAFSDIWTITPVKFINQQEFAPYIGNTDLSFIHIKPYKVKGEKKEIGAMALLKGGFNDTEFYLKSTLTFIAYDNWGVDKTMNHLAYKIPLMVGQLQYTIETVYHNDIRGKDFLQVTNNVEDFCNQNANSLVNKTLLIPAAYQMTKIIDIEYFKAAYPYDIKLADNDFIQQAIENKQSNCAVLQSSYNINKYNAIIDCDTYETLFCEFEFYDPALQNSLDKFDSDDLAAIIKASKKKSKSKKK